MRESLIDMRVSDEEILRLSYEKPSCFSELYDRHHKRFLAIARKATSSKDEAEDIVQETFVRIYKHGNKFLAKGGNFKHWSNIILRNCTSDQITKRRSKEVPLTEEMESSIGTTLDYEALESSNYIQSVFEKVNSTRVEILKLRFVLGKSFKEIAKILGTTSGAARVRVHRAKKDFIEIHDKLKPKIYGI